MGVYIYGVRKRKPHKAFLPTGESVKLYRTEFLGKSQDFCQWNGSEHARRRAATVARVWEGHDNPLCVEGMEDELHEGQPVRFAKLVVHDDIVFDEWIVGCLRFARTRWIVDPRPFSYPVCVDGVTRLIDGEWVPLSGYETERTGDHQVEFEKYVGPLTTMYRS